MPRADALDALAPPEYHVGERVMLHARKPYRKMVGRGEVEEVQPKLGEGYAYKVKGHHGYYDEDMLSREDRLVYESELVHVESSYCNGCELPNSVIVRFRLFSGGKILNTPWLHHPHHGRFYVQFDNHPAAPVGSLKP